MVENDGFRIPDVQRIVVLVDETSRCSPAS